MMTAYAGHEHLTLEQAADFDERLLDGAASADAAGHIATCATCAAALDAIHRTRSTLTSQPPIVMPTHIAERLHQAIDDETRAAQVPGGAATVTALAGRRRRVWLPIAGGIAAAAAVAIVVVPQLSTPASPETATAGKGAVPAPASAPDAMTLTSGVLRVQSGTDYLADARALKATALVDTASADLRFSSQQSAATTLAPDSAPVTTGGPVQAADARRPAPSFVVPPHLYGALEDPATLDACIARLVDSAAPVPPTLIDYATYGDKPALAIYFPGPQPGSLLVFVVGVRCGPAAEDILTSFPVTATTASPSP